MKVIKKVIANLTKCYSIAPLKYQGEDYFLVATEKMGRCILFDLEGNEVDTVWSEPGGAMSMVQITNSDGQFLSTHEFYSPNDSKNVKIVIVTPDAKGTWGVKTLAELPHIHRFDIINRNGVNYLIACTLKSGHAYKEDWSKPGKVYAAVISADCGVFQFIPPESPEHSWEIKQLLSTPASDAVLIDMDRDGEKELAVLSPFHGDQISIYKKADGNYKMDYAYEKKTEFTHAIYGGDLCGRPAVVIGHRKGNRDLLVFTYNAEEAKYSVEVIDRDCGSANVFHYVKDGKDIIISTNREIDEVAMYILEMRPEDMVLVGRHMLIIFMGKFPACGLCTKKR